MATISSPKPKTTSSHNASKDRKSGEDLDRQEAPPTSPQKTSLKSLQGKARMFVPTGAVDSPAALFGDSVTAPMVPPLPTSVPSPGKECLYGVVQRSLGKEAWNLNVMDYTSYTGEWYTAVDITIPASTASKCPVTTSQGGEALSAADQMKQSRAAQSLTKALRDVNPYMVLQPADHRAHVCAEFCARDKKRLCREFSQFGSCPRGDACRWEHAMIETFMINFILAPLIQSKYTDDTQKQATAKCESMPAAKLPQSGGRWQPSRPPQPPDKRFADVLAGLPPPIPAADVLAGLRLTQKKPHQPSQALRAPPDGLMAGVCTKEADACETQSIKALEPDGRPKNPRLVAKKRWSDIEDDSDANADC